jgi:hypothetical protein
MRPRERPERGLPTTMRNRITVVWGVVTVISLVVLLIYLLLRG